MTWTVRWHQVSLVGFQGERCVLEVENNPNIRKFYVSQPFAKASRKFFLLYAPVKVVLQVHTACAHATWRTGHILFRFSRIHVDSQHTVDTAGHHSQATCHSCAKSTKVT